jgi:hypothetical protein
MIAEASLALARLDGVRLEELALSCEALIRELGDADKNQRISFGCEARNAVQEMAVFARVLEATRSNLSVMHRLREMRARRLEGVDSADIALEYKRSLLGEIKLRS